MSKTDRAFVRILIQINSDVSLQFKVSIIFFLLLSCRSLSISIKLSVSGLIAKSLQVSLFHAICSTCSTHHIFFCPITKNIELKSRKYEDLHYAIFSSQLLPPATKTASPLPILGHSQPTISLPLRDQDSHQFKPTDKIKERNFKIKNVSFKIIAPFRVNGLSLPFPVCAHYITMCR
jgi:hypothetical protein